TYTVTTSQNQSLHSLQLGAGATLEVGANDVLAVSSSTTIVAGSQLHLDSGSTLQVAGQIQNSAGDSFYINNPSSFSQVGILVDANAALQVTANLLLTGGGAELLGANSSIESSIANTTLENATGLIWNGSGLIDGNLTLIND